jgi:dienelactone hydrolase
MDDRGAREITVDVEDASVRGDLTVPPSARGLVVFAHGSGSSRHSPRNQNVAERLRDAGFGTLLFDLLTPEEEAADARGAANRFDVEMLGRRLADVIDTVGKEPEVTEIPVGCFGASTGAAAALIAAAAAPDVVASVVSRGGRPDLAADVLPSVRAPTLLIVGGLDRQVIALNRQAKEAMQTEVVLSLVPGASHLFEEPGALRQVSDLAIMWFQRTLA